MWVTFVAQKITTVLFQWGLQCDHIFVIQPWAAVSFWRFWKTNISNTECLLRLFVLKTLYVLKTVGVSIGNPIMPRLSLLTNQKLIFRLDSHSPFVFQIVVHSVMSVRNNLTYWLQVRCLRHCLDLEYFLPQQLPVQQLQPEPSLPAAASVCGTAAGQTPDQDKTQAAYITTVAQYQSEEAWYHSLLMNTFNHFIQLATH